MKVLVSLLVLTAGLSLSGDEVLKKISERYETIETMSMDFVQEITYASASEKSVFSGHILLAKPGRMRMSVLDPDTQLLVSSGGSLWIYLQGAGQALFYDLTEESYPQVGTLIFNMTKEFGSSVLGRTQEKLLVKLMPLEESRYYDSLHATVQRRSYIVSGLSVFDRQANKIDYAFSKMRINIEVAESTFRFTPPPGTDVIKRN